MAEPEPRSHVNPLSPTIEEKESCAEILAQMFVADDPIQNSEAADYALQCGIRAEHFYKSKDQQIVKAIIDLRERGEPVTTLAVAALCPGFDSRDVLDNYVKPSAFYPPTLKSNCERLQRHHDTRQIRRLGMQLSVMQATNGADLFGQAYEMIDRIQNRSGAPASKIWDDPLDLMRLLDSPPAPVRWMIRNRIPQGRGILICGTGGSSKTRFLCQVAVGVTLGRLPWAWEIETTGRALLVLTEDTPGDVHRTIYNVCESMELTIDERRKVFSSLVIHPLAGKDCCLLGRDNTGALVTTDLYRGLERKIIDLENIQFVGIDPALSITQGSEMDQGEQRKLGREVDNLAVRTGAVVALASHASKASLSRDEPESHSSRGAGGITDVLRAEFTMRNMTTSEAQKAGIHDAEERKRFVQIVATKGNILPPSAYVPVWFRRDIFGNLEETQVDLTAGGAAGPSAKDLMSLDVLKNISADMPKRLEDWRSACIAQGVVTGATPDAQSKSMQRTIKKLAGAGMIVKGIGKGIWLPRCENEF